MPIRHKTFISYHHADQREVDNFINTFDHANDILIHRALGLANDIVNSTNTDYVMRRIREDYLYDSTVTIVLLGNCTWARRYIDWEIQASLRQGDRTVPNGLIGIKLPNFNNNSPYPNRINLNLLDRNSDQIDCYARVYSYPANLESLATWIEDAYNSRNRRNDLIVNPRERKLNNSPC